MRKELYRMLCRELKAIDLIKHIDLWNHNVEFIEQEENWSVRLSLWNSALYSGMRLFPVWNTGQNL